MLEMDAARCDSTDKTLASAAVMSVLSAFCSLIALAYACEFTAAWLAASPESVCAARWDEMAFRALFCAAAAEAEAAEAIDAAISVASC